MERNKPSMRLFENYTESKSTFIKNENNFTENTINDLDVYKSEFNSIKEETGDGIAAYDMDLKNEPNFDIEYQGNATMTFTCTECDFSCMSTDILANHKVCHGSELIPENKDLIQDHLNTNDFDFTHFYGENDFVNGGETWSLPNAENTPFVSNNLSPINFNSMCDSLNDNFNYTGTTFSNNIGKNSICVSNTHVQPKDYRGVNVKKIARTTVNRPKVNRERRGVRSVNSLPIFVKRKDYDPTKDILNVMSDDSTSSSETGSSDSNDDTSSDDVYICKEINPGTLNDTSSYSKESTSKLSNKIPADLATNTTRSKLRHKQPLNQMGVSVKEIDNTVAGSKLDRARAGLLTDDSYNSATIPTNSNTRRFKSQNHKEFCMQKVSNAARTGSEVLQTGLLSDEPYTSASVPFKEIRNIQSENPKELFVKEVPSTSGTGSNLVRDQNWLLSNKSITITPISNNSNIRNEQPQKHDRLGVKQTPCTTGTGSKIERIRTGMMSDDIYTSPGIPTSIGIRNAQPQNNKGLNMKHVPITTGTGSNVDRYGSQLISNKSSSSTTIPTYTHVPCTTGTGSNVDRYGSQLISNKSSSSTTIPTNSNVRQAKPKKDKRFSANKVPRITAGTSSKVNRGRHGKISGKTIPILVKRKDYDPSKDIINVMSDDSSSSESESSDSDDGINSSSNEGSFNDTEKQVNNDKSNIVWIE